jgi:hypothetical protein
VAFRVPIVRRDAGLSVCREAGWGRHFTDYPTLRATPGKLLANRLPDVAVLTSWWLT